MFRLWGLLMTNTRMVILFILLFIGQPVWYFWIEVTVFNVLLAYLIYRQERMSQSLLELAATIVRDLSLVSEIKVSLSTIAERIATLHQISLANLRQRSGLGAAAHHRAQSVSRSKTSSVLSTRRRDVVPGETQRRNRRPNHGER